MKRIVFQLSVLLAVISLSFCSQADKKNPLNDPAIPPAEKKLRQDIADHPDSLLLKENLIQYFCDNNNYGMAVTETDRAIARDSNNGRLWYIKATLLSQMGDTSKAITAWEQVIKYDPSPANLIALATLYAFTKNSMAMALGDILFTDPRANARSQALFIKGLYLNNTGQYEVAIQFFDQCIQLDYTNQFAYREKAICLYELGQYEASLKVLELALTINKNNEEAYYWVGRSMEKLGHKDEAIAAYQAALELAPDFVEAKDALAKLGVKL